MFYISVFNNESNLLNFYVTSISVFGPANVDITRLYCTYIYFQTCFGSMAIHTHEKSNTGFRDKITCYEPKKKH